MCIGRSSRFVLQLMTLSALLAGCERAPQQVAGASRSVVADVIVSVSNQSSGRMLVYLKAGSTEHSLGMVPERSSRSFSLPSGLDASMGALLFEAREPHASTGVRSSVFGVSAGQQVLWTFDKGGSGAVIIR
jgi:hypothetical protein